MRILGVRLDNSSLEEAKTQAQRFLNTPGGHKIFTPNPEILTKATRDRDFRRALNMAHLNLIDGFGVQIACLYKYRSWPVRLPGADFMLVLCHLAATMGKSVYLLGTGREEVVEGAAKALNALYPNLKIVGYDAGPKITENNQVWEVNEEENTRTIENINRVNPDVLLVAFGMGKQEKWICRYLGEMPSVRVAMGVGGALDYKSGYVRRAPLFLRKIGLEWLYRLVCQPRRLGRIWQAVVVFPLLIVFSRTKYDDHED